MNNKLQARLSGLLFGNLKSKTCTELSRSIQNLKWAAEFLGIFVLLVGCVGMAEAQQPAKVPRIGILELGSPSASAHGHKAFQQGLRELGYVEGKNIILEYRYADGKLDLLPELAAELVRLKVDIIVVTGGDPQTRAAKNATKTIPIVMTGGGLDPVEAGLVESLARPGGNVTGITNLGGELGGKRLELLKEVVTKVARCRGSLRSGRSARCSRGERGSSSRGAGAGIDCSALGGTSCGRF